MTGEVKTSSFQSQFYPPWCYNPFRTSAYRDDCHLTSHILDLKSTSLFSKLKHQNRLFNVIPSVAPQTTQKFSFSAVLRLFCIVFIFYSFTYLRFRWRGSFFWNNNRSALLLVLHCLFRCNLSSAFFLLYFHIFAMNFLVTDASLNFIDAQVLIG